jgi:hypothetical protein
MLGFCSGRVSTARAVLLQLHQQAGHSSVSISAVLGDRRSSNLGLLIKPGLRRLVAKIDLFRESKSRATTLMPLPQSLSSGDGVSARSAASRK